MERGKFLRSSGLILFNIPRPSGLKEKLWSPLGQRNYKTQLCFSAEHPKIIQYKKKHKWYVLGKLSLVNSKVWITWIKVLNAKCRWKHKFIVTYDYTMHFYFPMRIGPTITYENIWIYFIIIFVNILHVSVTFCGHQ